jgi:hypothetical protein
MAAHLGTGYWKHGDFLQKVTPTLGWSRLTTRGTNVAGPTGCRPTPPRSDDRGAACRRLGLKPAPTGKAARDMDAGRRGAKKPLSVQRMPS